MVKIFNDSGEFIIDKEGYVYNYEIIMNSLQMLTAHQLKQKVEHNQIEFQKIVTELTRESQTANHIDYVVANLYNWYILNEMH